VKNPKRLVAVGSAILAISVVLGAPTLRAQDDHDDGGISRSLTIMGPNRSWLGVELKDITADQARQMKLGGEYGALVTKVEENSPAAKAGLQTGDVIVEFAGEHVRSVAELSRLVRETPPGRSVEIRVRRNGETKTLNATIEARQGPFEPLMGDLNGNMRSWPQVRIPDFNFDFGPFGGPRLGVSVEELTPQLAQYFGVSSGTGVLVREVSPGSAAEKAGIKAGDCIVRIGSTPIASASDIHRALTNLPGESHEAVVTIVRDRKEETLQVHIESPRQPMTMESTAAAALPSAEQLRAEATELRQRIGSQSRALADQFARARLDTKTARDEELQLQRRFEQLAPEMKALQDRLKELRAEYSSDII